MKYRIIHISDLHFSGQADPSRIDDKSRIIDRTSVPNYSSIEVFLDNIHKFRLTDGKVILAITGDICSCCSQEGFGKAKEFVGKCVDRLNITNRQVVVCPGNHDIAERVDPTEQIAQFKYSMERYCNPFNQVQFLVEGDCLLYPFRSPQISYKNNTRWLASIFRRRRLQTAFIGRDALANLSRIPKDPIVRIALLHHHVTPVWGMEAKKYDQVMDAGKFLQDLQKWGFSAILHGHKHLSSASFYQEMENDNQENGLFVLGIGSLNYDGVFSVVNIEKKDRGTIISRQTHSVKDGQLRHLGESINCSPKSIAGELRDKVISVEGSI